MRVYLELKKVKRTGFLPTFLCGGILAASFPVINMAARTEIYLTQQGSPLQILFNANWQIIAMLNVLLVITGTCILYNTEYASNAMQKIKSLPTRAGSVFLSKVILTIFMCILILTIEAVAVTFCSYYWFETGNGFLIGLCKNFGYELLLMLPCITISLLISEACKNIWISLGIGVICVFTATMLPSDNFNLSLFPFAMPFQIFTDTNIEQVIRYICTAVAEFVVICLSELVFIKIRREFE